jgi:putative heme-binding domain-containing protein
LPIVKELLTHDKDAEDHRQPLLLWWAIEDKCGSDREAVLAMFSDKELWSSPLVQEHLLNRLMRRFAATGRREDLITCSKLFAMSPGAVQTARLTAGFEEAFKGRPLVALPEELLSAMERAGGESVLIGARRGKAEAVKRALTSIADARGDVGRRVQLIQIFGEAKQAEAVPILLTVLRDEKNGDLRRAALNALQAYDSAAIADEVVTLLGGFTADVRTGAFSLLSSRPVWALTLLKSVESGRVPKVAVPSETVRRIHGMEAPAVKDELRRLLGVLWPNVRQATSVELEREIARLTGVIEATTGSPYAGKKLFLENCGVCHKLFNVGAQIGPELTTYKRDDLGNMLLNIVNPNAEIREGYENFNLETKDGRNLSGFLADKDSQVIVLRGADGQSVAVPQKDIEKLEPVGASLMPEGLLSNLSDQQVRDLFAFLRSTQPLPE